jgi:hypothetical protein
MHTGYCSWLLQYEVMASAEGMKMKGDKRLSESEPLVESTFGGCRHKRELINSGLIDAEGIR